eukprot:sb/3477138/
MRYMLTTLKTAQRIYPRYQSYSSQLPLITWTYLYYKLEMNVEVVVLSSKKSFLFKSFLKYASLISESKKDYKAALALGEDKGVRSALNQAEQMSKRQRDKDRQAYARMFK